MRLKSAANSNTNTYDDDNVAFLEEKMSEYERWLIAIFLFSSSLLLLLGGTVNLKMKLEPLE